MTGSDDTQRRSRHSDEQRKADLVIAGATQVLTCVASSTDLVGRMDGATIAVAGDRIIAVGPGPEAERQVDLTGATLLDVSGKIVAPGFIDCHTHVVFGGSRAREYALRMTHTSDAIRAMGIPTGILATVDMTRSASEEELTWSAADRLRGMLLTGTTTVESKSGYGLSLDEEVKMLEVNRRLSSAQPVDIVSTFLGAHEVPRDVERGRYIETLVHDMIPQVGERSLAQFCDVYCDEGFYTADESRLILEAGEAAGLRAKIHTDAYSDIGGADMAADLGVISADHLNYTSVGSMGRLAEAEVVGVVMPALDFAVRHARPFDARAMMDAGMVLALATDICPACWVESMQYVMQLACRLYQFSPEEALLAATWGAAKAVGLERDRGTLEVGKRADMQIWNVPTFEDVVYRLGNNAVDAVIVAGEIVVENRTARW